MKFLTTLRIKTIILSAFLLGNSSLVQSAQVDLLIMYGGNAKRLVESNIDASIETYLYFLADSANDIYRDNGLDITLNVVAITDELSYYNPVPSSRWGRALQDWQVQKDLREQYRADAVVFIGGPNGRQCGVAPGVARGTNGQLDLRNAEYAYNITAVGCGVSTFVHELGHNMGLNHNLVRGDRGGVFSYGVGHGVRGEFATIMAYESVYNGPRLPFFSNPDNTQCQGLPCGVEGRADSIRALKPVLDTFASFSEYLYD